MRRVALATLVGPLARRRRVQAEERVDLLDGEVGPEGERCAGAAQVEEEGEQEEGVSL